MKIFITGASGFLGTSFRRIVKDKGYEVFYLSRSESAPSFIKGDMSRQGEWADELKKNSPDVVINFSWENVADYNNATPEEAMRNFINSLNLFNLSIELGCRKFIQIGTISERSGDMNSFLASKIALRSFGEAISKSCVTQFLWVRPFYIYGPGQRRGALLPSIILTLLENDTLEIRNPLFEQDFIYVDDVTRAVLKIAEKSEEKFQIYEVGAGKTFLIGRLANIAYKQLGFPEKYSEEFLNQSRDGTPVVADTKLISQLGWFPEVDYEKGVELMINYYRNLK